MQRHGMEKRQQHQHCFLSSSLSWHVRYTVRRGEGGPQYGTLALAQADSVSQCTAASPGIPIQVRHAVARLQPPTLKVSVPGQAQADSGTSSCRQRGRAAVTESPGPSLSRFGDSPVTPSRLPVSGS